jgi:hypothetical protein
MERWGYGTVSVHASLDGLVAIWSARGIVTATELPWIMSDASAWHHQCRPASILCDYRHATIAVPLEQFERVAGLLIQPGQPIAVPMAIVPFPAQLLYFQLYARSMQARGIGRVVSLHYREALRWAREIARDQVASGFHQSAGVLSSRRRGISLAARRRALSQAAPREGIDQR